VTKGDTMQDVGKLILRLTVGGLLLLHGIGKILQSEMAMGFIQGALQKQGLPPQLAYGVYVGEVLGPVLVIAGFASRLGGLMIFVNMVMAIFLVQMGNVGVLNQGHGWAVEVEALFALGGLAIVFLGSGRLAVSRGNGKLD
jgi:putative oxidoreductase